MDQLFKNRTLWIVIVFIVVLALATQAFLSWYGGDGTGGIFSWFSTSLGGGASVVTDGNNRVIYTDKGFSAKSVSISEDKGMGCLVAIQNDSSKPLTFRVGPYEEGKEKGVAYPTLESGQSQTFDPRYSGYEELPFYSKETIKHQFTVIYEPSCR